MWFLQLTHRSGTPVILVKTEHLASGLAALLDAAQYDSFRDEPAHLHKTKLFTEVSIEALFGPLPSRISEKSRGLIIGCGGWAVRRLVGLFQAPRGFSRGSGLALEWTIGGPRPVSVPFLENGTRGNPGGPILALWLDFGGVRACSSGG